MPPWKQEDIDNHESNALQLKWFVSVLVCCIICLTLSSAGLIGNLKSCSPPLFRLYTILKERQDRKDGTITQEEIDIASGKTDFDSSMTDDFVKQLDQKTENIRKAFAQQEVKSLVRSLFYLTYVTYMFTKAHALTSRACGIRKNSSDFLLIGSLLVTSRLMKLINQNFWSFSIMHTTLWQLSRFPVAMQSKDV
jgi:hypothetical protein